MNVPLLLTFARQDLVDRYAGSLLGAGWTFLHPLAQILIFVAIFSGLMGARLPGSDATYGYSIYLVSGLIAWLAFANTVTRTCDVFAAKGGILRKVPVPLMHLPLYIVLSESVIYIISLSLFGAFLLAIGQGPTPAVVLLPFVFALQQLFAYALGLWVAMLGVFFKDLRELVTVLLQFWFWFTPIVYVDTILPPWASALLVYNPANAFISAYHAMFIPGETVAIAPLVALVVVVQGLLMAAYGAFRKLEKDLRDFL
ncbi:MAG: ABC transporter permease [Candidatus Competibacterales bacterium]